MSRLSFEFHIFAHVSGRYQTADCSSELEAAERRALEQFFFGQTDDRSFLENLIEEPGVIWRRVGSRYALTRVLPGQRDAHDRATLTFETILVDAAVANQVALSLEQVVKSPWERLGQSIYVELTPASAHAPSSQIVSDALDAANAGNRFQCDARRVSLSEVGEIVRRGYADPDFSLCFKCLNHRAPVTVAFCTGFGTQRASSARAKGLDMSAVGSSRSSGAAATWLLVLACANLALLVYIAMRPGPKASPLLETENNLKNAIEAARDDAKLGTARTEELAKKVDTGFEQARTTAEARANEATQRLNETATQLATKLDEQEKHDAEFRSQLALQVSTALKPLLEESVIPRLDKLNIASAASMRALATDIASAMTITKEMKNLLYDYDGANKVQLQERAKKLTESLDKLTTHLRNVHDMISGVGASK